MARAVSTPLRKIGQPHVYKWLNSLNPDRMPPAEYCPSIERATDGQVRCEDLRPDVDWSVLRNSDCHDQPKPEPESTFGDLGEPRSGVDRREEERRTLDAGFGDLGEPRDGDRRQEDRRHCDEGVS